MMHMSAHELTTPFSHGPILAGHPSRGGRPTSPTNMGCIHVPAFHCAYGLLPCLPSLHTVVNVKRHFQFSILQLIVYESLLQTHRCHPSSMHLTTTGQLSHNDHSSFQKNIIITIRICADLAFSSSDPAAEHDICLSRKLWRYNPSCAIPAGTARLLEAGSLNCPELMHSLHWPLACLCTCTVEKHLFCLTNCGTVVGSAKSVQEVNMSTNDVPIPQGRKECRELAEGSSSHLSQWSLCKSGERSAEVDRTLRSYWALSGLLISSTTLPSPHDWHVILTFSPFEAM